MKQQSMAACILIISNIRTFNDIVTCTIECILPVEPLQTAPTKWNQATDLSPYQPTCLVS